MENCRKFVKNARWYFFGYAKGGKKMGKTPANRKESVNIPNLGIYE